MYIFYGFDKDYNRIELDYNLSLKEIREMGIVSITVHRETEIEIKSASSNMKRFFENMASVFTGEVSGEV